MHAQDEAIELTGGPGEGTPEAGLAEMAAHCSVAAVTLGERGCLVQAHAEPPFAEPAASGVRVVDATGFLNLRSSLSRVLQRSISCRVASHSPQGMCEGSMHGKILIRVT